MVKAAKAGDKKFYWDRYEKQLAALKPKDVYFDLLKLSAGKEIVILCYEKDHNSCHRKRVAEWLSAAGFQVSEL